MCVTILYNGKLFASPKIDVMEGEPKFDLDLGLPFLSNQLTTQASKLSKNVAKKNSKFYQVGWDPLEGNCLMSSAIW